MEEGTINPTPRLDPDFIFTFFFSFFYRIGFYKRENAMTAKAPPEGAVCKKKWLKWTEDDGVTTLPRADWFLPALLATRTQPLPPQTC